MSNETDQRGQNAEERVVDTATGAEAPAEISEERVQHIFSNIAKQYARFNAVSSFGLFKGWLRKTVDAATCSTWLEARAT